MILLILEAFSATTATTALEVPMRKSLTRKGPVSMVAGSPSEGSPTKSGAYSKETELMGPKEASKGDDAAALPGRNQMMPLLRHRSLPLLIVILNNFAFKKPQYSPLEDLARDTGPAWLVTALTPI